MFDTLQHVLANEKQVNPRVAGNMDGWMDGRTDACKNGIGWKLCLTMPAACSNRNESVKFL